MKHLKVKTIAISLTLIMLRGAALLARHGQGDGFRRYSVARYYNTGTEKTITGEIVKIQTVAGLRNRCYNSTQLTVKTDTKTYTVYLGPIWYVNDKIKLKAGDKITITGSYIKVNSNYLLLARELKRDGKTYKFRRTDGTPYWAGYNSGGRGRRRR